jgi:hypothetical protein
MRRGGLGDISDMSRGGGGAVGAAGTAALCELPDESVVATLGRLVPAEKAVVIYQSFQPEMAARLDELNRAVIRPLLRRANPVFQAQVERFLSPERFMRPP